MDDKQLADKACELAIRYLDGYLTPEEVANELVLLVQAADRLPQ